MVKTAATHQSELDALVAALPQGGEERLKEANNKYNKLHRTKQRSSAEDARMDKLKEDWLLCKKLQNKRQTIQNRLKKKPHLGDWQQPLQFQVLLLVFLVAHVWKKK